MAITENSRKILDYVKANASEDFTAKDIAADLGLTAPQVNGSITAFQKKGYMVREEAEVELADGSHEKVKLIRITDAGMAFDPDAEVAE